MSNKISRIHFTASYNRNRTTGITTFIDAHSRWLKFLPTADNGKTVKVVVVNKETHDKLGYIAWYNRFRQYSFYPEPNTVYEKTCLNDIIKCIHRLEEIRRDNVQVRKAMRIDETVKAFL